MPSVPGLSRRATVAIGADGEVTMAVAPGLWPFTQARWRLRRSVNADHLDPVNLLVAHTRAATVAAALAACGWRRPDDGATHVTWYRGRRVGMRDHIALGTRAERVHARLFDVAGHTVVAAHHEVADARGRHVVTSWDRARSAVADALVEVGFRDEGRSPILLPENLRGVSGDGRIQRLGPSS